VGFTETANKFTHLHTAATVEAINTVIHLLVQIEFSLLKFPADPFTKVDNPIEAFR